jgi:DNA helicase IV
MLSDEIKALIAEEERKLEETLYSIRNQQLKSNRVLNREAQNARDLTARYVGTTREEDKHLIASDEAVAHGLSKAKFKELRDFEKVLNKPYFARMIVEEQSQNGEKRQIEYKLGTISNVDCQIVDWRKAPISKLFYEYREGDEYCEMIQQREREGVILLRHKLEIEEGILKRISCRFGDFVFHEGEWIKAGSRTLTRSGNSYGRLPDILALISKEQFQAITEEKDHAVLIQGFAGTGKTTVALYRLSWLMHQGADAPAREECAIIVKSVVLKRYIEDSLSLLDLEGVLVRTIEEWNDLKKYKHIVVDEVQDLSRKELNLIVSSVQNTNQLTLVGDSRQDIRDPLAVKDEDSFIGWSGIQEYFKESFSKMISLTVSHRSSIPIMNFAHAVRGERYQGGGRVGKAPIWFKCLSEESGVQEAIKWLNRVQERLPGTLTAVLCSSREEARYVLSMLEPTFQYGVRLGTEGDISFEEGILVCDIPLIKGLEFPQVLIWNPSQKSYPTHSYGFSERSKNLLYVGITRAESLVGIVTWGEHSKLLPSPYSKLVRLIEEELPEKDDKDNQPRASNTRS